MAGLNFYDEIRNQMLQELNWSADWSLQYPHCDPLVLHAPSKCKFCDESGLQYSRQRAGVNFTGEPNDPKLKKDYAVRARPLDLIERWHGNIPHEERS